MRRVPVPGLAAGRTRLDPATSHHLLHVLRLRRGEELGLSDGAGGLADAVLVDVDGAIAIVDVGVVRVAPISTTRVVLLGMPKPALVEEAVQLGTEAGATRFLLIRAERTPPGSARAERLTKIAANAAEQCGRADLPDLDVMDLDAAIVQATGERWLAHPGARPLEATGAAATVAVGPEGGWSPGELQRLQQGGFRPAGLGAHVLRAPTAVAVALGRLWDPN